MGRRGVTWKGYLLALAAVLLILLAGGWVWLAEGSTSPKADGNGLGLKSEASLAGQGSRKTAEDGTAMAEAMPGGVLGGIAGGADGGTGQDRPLTLGFSQLGSESDWRIANTLSIQEAAKESGIRLLFDNAEQSQTKQIEAVRSFIERKVDVIAIAPVVQSGWEPVLREARQAGIPVVILDRLVEVGDPSLYVTFIGSDFYEEGRKAGRYLLDKMADRPDPIGVVELRGTEGSTPSIDRGKGFHDVLRTREGFRMLGSEPADFTYEKGKEVMLRFLQEHGRSIRVLFAHNDDMALGALEAIEEYGMVPGKDIIIISVDGTRKAFEKLAEGKLNSVVECNPLLGPKLMQAVRELLEGRTLPKRILTPESIFTEVTAEREVALRKY